MITLSKIAKLAHVSVSTASKAFSMSSEVSEQTRQEVFRVAQEYGCFKKFYNAKYPKFVIAVICPEFLGQHYTTMVALLQEHLLQLGCEVCVASTNFSAEAETDLLEYYHNYSNVDGIVIIDGKTAIPASYEIPVVSISPRPDPNVGVRLCTDCSEAMLQAVEHFLAHGVRRIGFLGEARTNRKLTFFRETAEARQAVCEPVVVTERRFEEGGYAAMEQLLAKGDLPRALVCAYDHLAIGAIRCLADHGLSVPEDVAILGMDDIPDAEYLLPRLSSVNFRTGEICRLAAQSILDLLHTRPAEPVITLPAQLRLRESTEF